MRFTRHTTALAAAALTGALVLSACGGDSGDPGDGGSSGGASDGQQTVAVVLKTLSSPFWLQVAGGVEDGGEAEGVNVTLAGATAETQVQEQIDKVRAAITQQVDALVVAPTQAEQLEPILQQAVDAGIPVLLVDTDIEGWEGKETFVGTDNYQAGVTAGEYILEQADSGQIAVIRGVPGNPSTDSRIDGALDTLEGSDIEVVADLSANSDRAEGRAVMADILLANPDVSIVFAANDDMALGAIEAIKAAGLDLEDILVVGVDGTSDAVDSMLAGELDASVAQNSYDMGRRSVELAVELLNGGTIEDRVDTGVTVVTTDTAEEYGAQLEEQAAAEDVSSD
ncbi:sugar ABC transporter substrate-binding protein [Georgenia sp. 311]|uniref:Sugar ABC transporter substrate-binding protein n=1 Tax=Georgenia wutianyii TaxID=2585135 RepID=A0ABX5VME8_9MICO|nr:MULTISPECIES: sugar ABC transporter substrate-binding protein [Georgenia]QDB79666.1 sugar ABC transporter substrate-binding protein [Georgenia wutianyii]TNC17014.1 sugar ABC transporter substrate-binding protein [Georgenia sp. 311]